ncbi:WD40-repeat-containing domain protein [Sporodiniella umbellata]|nr:WD40-repeat-containing domain protein [Sporodiniella umbellata]
MDGLYAAGSYSQSIGIYDARNDALCLKLTGFHGGTTQVKFSYDGQYLFSASRHANTILCWDIRDSANVLYELPRPGKTNQRIHFDFDPTGTHLVTGDERGQLTAYRIAQPGQYETVSQWKAHQDLISCAAFNPVYPILATCSGQRKFENDEERVVDNSIQAWRVPGHYEWFAEHD